MNAINDLSRHNGPLRAQLLGAVEGVLDSGWFVLGQSVKSFEQAFAAYCGAASCLSVANGTDALELALRALDVQPGDRVLNVANAGGYSSIAILSAGAEPTFIDIDPRTHLLDADVLDAALAQRPKALIVTHLYGRAAPMDRIMAAAQRHGVPVIEDCAQAHGARWQGKKVGTWGALGTFSFYPTKNLGALGDGGALVTSTPELAQRLSQLRQYGWSTKYHCELGGGRNSRLDELQAAVLLAKLPLLDGWNVRRVDIARRYGAKIRHPTVQVPEIGEAGSCVAHLYVVRCARRDALAAHLRAQGVPADIHYPVPDHRQPILADRFGGVALPRTVEACATVLTLPCFPEMTDDEVDTVACAVNGWDGT